MMDKTITPLVGTKNDTRKINLGRLIFVESNGTSDLWVLVSAASRHSRKHSLLLLVTARACTHGHTRCVVGECSKQATLAVLLVSDRCPARCNCQQPEGVAGEYGEQGVRANTRSVLINKQGLLRCRCCRPSLNVVFFPPQEAWPLISCFFVMIG